MLRGVALAVAAAALAACGPSKPAPRASAKTPVKAVAPAVAEESADKEEIYVRYYRLPSGKKVRLTDWSSADTCHACSGEFRIGYLTPRGRFRDVQVFYGGWGGPPFWKLRHDLGREPVIEVVEGGTHQGCTSGYTTLVKLHRNMPSIMAVFKDDYRNNEDSSRGRLNFDTKIKAEPGGFKVIYTGNPSAIVHYRRIGGRYRPDRKLRLEEC